MRGVTMSHRRTKPGRNDLLNYDGVIAVMKYLGYNMTPQAEATASALAGKVCYNVMLPSIIATEYAKHNNLVLSGEEQPI